MYTHMGARTHAEREGGGEEVNSQADNKTVEEAEVMNKRAKE